MQAGRWTPGASTAASEWGRVRSWLNSSVRRTLPGAAARSRTATPSSGTSEADLRAAGAVAVYRDVAPLPADLDDSPLATAWAD